MKVDPWRLQIASQGACVQIDEIQKLALRSYLGITGPQGEDRLNLVLIIRACTSWARYNLPPVIDVPATNPDSSSDTARLLRALSDQLPPLRDFPQAGEFGLALRDLARVANYRAEGQSADLVGEHAFHAGFSLAALGPALFATDDQLEAEAAMEKVRNANAVRLEKVRTRSLKFEREIFEFAANEIAADPSIAATAIQRRFLLHLKDQRTTDSDHIAKIVGRLRKSGKLPPKRKSA